MSWENIFLTWAKSPSVSEQEKCDNAERAVRKAVENSSELSSRSVRVFPQGSYRNRTNVGTESDVDIGVLCTDTFYFDLPEGFTREDFGINPATYIHSQFKNHLHEGLNSYFGSGSIERGNKAFDVHENTYRIDADVVPYFEYRLYQKDGSYLTGVCFFTDKNEFIINWPEQNYENGVAKNDDTGERFKAITRTIKSLRTKMAEDGIIVAKPIPSYLIECMLWNVPKEGFNHDTYEADVRYVLAHLFNNTQKFDDCKEWREVNELKYLFRDALQSWTLTQAHNFISEAWDYIGFE